MYVALPVLDRLETPMDEHRRTHLPPGRYSDNELLDCVRRFAYRLDRLQRRNLLGSVNPPRTPRYCVLPRHELPYERDDSPRDHARHF